jgi:hypothetical protein
MHTPNRKSKIAFFCAAIDALLISILLLAGCSAKKAPLAETDLNKKVTFAVALFLEPTLPEWTRTQISSDLNFFKNIRVDSGPKVLTDLAVSLTQLQQAKVVDDLKMTAFPYSVLFYVYDTGAELRVKTFNFYTRVLADRSITEALASGQSWVLQDKTGLITLVARPESAEFYIDYQFVGLSPILVNVKPGRHLLSVTHRGKVFHTLNIDPGSKSDFQFDDIIATENILRDKDGIEMTAEERAGAAFISSLILIFLSSIIVLPILLL